MPCCAVLTCKNESRTKNVSHGGVSYHRFPKDPSVKEKWIYATGRQQWMPSKSSTICSEHFHEKDIQISKKGYKYLNQNAIPVQKILVFLDHSDSDKNEPGSSKKRLQDTPPLLSFISEPKTKKVRQGDSELYNSPMSTPRKKILRKQLHWSHSKIRKQNLKIKRLQSRNRRLKRKIKNIEELLKSLEEKFAMTNEDLVSLKNTNIKVNELITRMSGSKPKAGKYSPALRSFALTLNYYSPRAYDYVRRTFNTCLPHPRTLKKWYTKVGGDPGFTSESFAALKRKADSLSHKIIAALVIDEMSIRRRIEWDGSKLHGYVDMGTGLDGDHLAEAKEALVFLVTAINQNFKVPVAYFLVDGITGLQRSELVKKCLEMCHDAGVRIVALTFDGCAANISMAGHLGCSFLTSNVKFEHPVTKDLIVAVLDPCHMLKLLRNSFENYQTLIDKDGNKISWQYLVDLNSLQKKETFHLANKLKDRHINFKNERMKVKLASQLFSLSIAEAIQFCRECLGIESFRNSEPTEIFLKLINNIFDIFNSRNLHFYGFKKALNNNNATKIFDYLNKAADYINNLKLENGTLLVNSPRKVGYLGFLGCIEAIKYLFATLIQTNILIYLPFYKLSQDHIELFFCNVRAHGGSNNNPTVRQFVSAYKKMLVHVELKDTDRGNCSALEQISILNCSSAVERINLSTVRQDLSNENYEEKDEDYSEVDLHLSDFSKQSIAHIAGFIVKQLINKIKCDICVGALITEKNKSLHRFIIAKDKGGLLYPSENVIKICQTSETFLKECQVFNKDFFINKIMRQFIGTSIFQNINYHQLGEFPTSNHVTDLMKAITIKYINIRMHHLLKLKIKQSKRQVLNKYVLFQGQ